MAKAALDLMVAQLGLLPPKERPAARRRKVAAWLDAGHGSCLLREAALAAMVQNALLHFDADRYRLLAWVVMPNHVHAIVQPAHGYGLAAIVASWKKFTAREIRAWQRTARGIDGRKENADCEHPVWHKEYWDRYIRNELHLRQTVQYIHENPVRAGLTVLPEDWRWSSAGRLSTPGS
jgi:putative transposase